jgi:WD40 repeat protein
MGSVKGQSITRVPITVENASRVTPMAILGKGAVHDMAWSLDRRTLAVATEAGVWLYDGRPNLPSTISRQLKGYVGRATTITLTPDGGTVIVGSNNQPGLHFFDVETGELLSVLKPDTMIHLSALSDDGAKLAVLNDGKSLHVWNLATQQQSPVFESGKYAQSIDLDADGSRMLVGNSVGYYTQGSWIELWDVAEVRMPFFLKGHLGSVYDVQFNPDGSLAASVGHDGTVRLWDVETGENLRVLEGHFGELYSVAFSPDGSFVASAGWDGAVRLWDVATGEQRGIIREEPELPVWEVAFSPDGKTLAYSNTGIKFWDYQQGESAVRAFAEDHAGSVRALEFHPEGTTLVVYSLNMAHVWDMQTLILRGALPVYANNAALRVTASPDGTKTAVTDFMFETGAIAVGDLPLKGHSRRVRDMAFNADASLLVSGSEDQTVRLWDLTTGESRAVLEGHTNTVTGVAFSADGKRIASCSFDGTIRLWDTGTGQSLFILEGHIGSVNDVAFSPDGTILASGGSDKTVHLWDVATGQPLAVLDSQPSLVSNLLFNPDGTILASGSEDGTTRLWGVPES